MSQTSPITEQEAARRLVLTGRFVQALERLEHMEQTPATAALKVDALVRSGRLQDAECALVEAETVHGPDMPHMRSARRTVEADRGVTEETRRLRSSAYAAVAALTEEPHENVFLGRDPDLIVCPREGATTVAVVFGLGLTTAAHDVLLASAGCSVVHVLELRRRVTRDPAGYFAGREAFAEQIRAACVAMGAQRIVFIGWSLMGLAALTLARSWVSGSIAFSPPSTLNPAVFQAFKDLRGGMLEAFSENRDVVGLDALSEIAAAGTPALVVCGRGHSYDRDHARRLEQAPNVRVRLLETASHNTSLIAAAEGLLPQLVADLTG